MDPLYERIIVSLINRQNALLLECRQQIADLVRAEQGLRDQLADNVRALQELRDQLAEDIISGSAGLSEDQISENLKVSTIQERKMMISSRGGKEDELVPETLLCAICLGYYEDNGETMIGTLDCGHEYHPQCIKAWLLRKNACPVCRATALNVEVDMES